MQVSGSIYQPQAACKCCGGETRLFGVVDFNKNCEEQHGRRVMPLCGMLVDYRRCTRCGLLFTTAFDAWAQDQWARYVYNEQYALVDPEYEEARPARFAGWFTQLFGTSRGLRILDYGSGNGRFAGLLREAGFGCVNTYDPLGAPLAVVKPTGRYDCITCIEVFEHSTTPAQTLGEMAELLSDDGLLVLATRLQPQDIEQIGVSWWYLAPRNGHVSLHSAMSLDGLLMARGLQRASFDDGLHVAFRPPNVPSFAAHFLKRQG